jgi:hypothetical protein
LGGGCGTEGGGCGDEVGRGEGGFEVGLPIGLVVSRYQ